MKKINRYTLTFLSALFAIFSSLFGQTANFHQFIEPNISISFDSNYFKISNHYSNETYGRESYDFLYGTDSLKKVEIHISADHPVKYPPKKIIDSIIMSGSEDMKKMQSDTFSVINIDKQIREINGFSCIGFVSYNKMSGKYSTFIRGYHYSDDDDTKVTCLSNYNNLDAVYLILTNFLSGFKSYSSSQIQTEDSIIKSKYSVVVTSFKTEDDAYKYRPKTFVGIVSTKEKLEHTIEEVRLTLRFMSGFEVFRPNGYGTIIIFSNDREKGTVVKQGELVILNSFGKKVKIPFKFSYENTGPL